MNKNQVREAELLIRKITLKDLEIWLQEQYAEIDAQLLEIEKANEQNPLKALSDNGKEE